MSQYKIILKNKALNARWDLPCKSGFLEWRYNNIHTGTLYVDFVYLTKYLSLQGITPRQLFEGGFRNIYIYRNDSLQFAGFLSNVRYQHYTEAFNVELDIKSWLGYFENRYLTQTFSNTDQGEIAWQAINGVNDIGITKGTVTSTNPRSKTYREDDVAKIVRSFGKDLVEDGYDFDISNQKVFTAAPSLGVDRLNVIFNESNTYNFALSVPLVGGVYNRGKILGSGFGEDQSVRSYDAGSTYSDAWNILEARINEINVSDNDTLDDRIKKYVEQTKNPIPTFSFRTNVDSPDANLYAVGDRVVVKKPSLEINELRKIRKKTLYFGENEYVELQFAQEV